MEHYRGEITGRGSNLQPVCMPDETCEPGCCSSRSNYHPAKRDLVCPFRKGRSVNPSLYNFSIDFFFFFLSVISSRNLLEYFIFRAWEFYTLNWPFTWEKCQFVGKECWEVCICMCVLAFNGQVDKRFFFFLSSHPAQNIDDSPHSPLLQTTFSRLCVHLVRVIVCPPQGDR